MCVKARIRAGPGGSSSTLETVVAGRRSGDSNTRDEIIDAARREFADRGYDGTSMRGVAREAGVDPALVHHYFDGKDGLFVAATVLPQRPDSGLAVALDVPHERLGEALTRYLLSIWDDPERRAAMLGVFRSSATTERAVDVLRESIATPLARELGRAARLDEPDRHLPFVLSQTVGLIFARYVLKLEPLASMPSEQIVDTIGPTLQRYLDL